MLLLVAWTGGVGVSLRFCLLLGLIVWLEFLLGLKSLVFGLMVY